MNNAGGTRAFYSNTNEKLSVWHKIIHDCDIDLSHQLIQSFKDVSKKSQANFRTLAEGNVSLACLSFSAFEKPFLVTALSAKNNFHQLFTCLTGIQADATYAFREDYNYFDDFVRWYLFLKEQSDDEFRVYKNAYRFSLVDSPEMLSTTFDKSDDLGLVLNMKGGHMLGNSVFIENGVADSREYEAIVIENVERLKGLKPLFRHSGDYLLHPVFYISLASKYDNGICSSAPIEMVYPSKSEVGKWSFDIGEQDGFSPLGIKVAKALLDDKKGKRVLIDIAGMSPQARKAYYGMLKNPENDLSDVPVIASSVGVSGLSWDTYRHFSKKDWKKGTNSILNHSLANLSTEDIKFIHRSEGLIGISLNRAAIAGKKVDALLGKTVEGSAQYRKTYTKAIVANILTVVEAVNERTAWDRICLGTGFDNLSPAIPIYETAEELPKLQQDILQFLESPEDIFNLFTAEEIEDLKFGYKSKELVEKIFHSNALTFLLTHFPNDQLQLSRLENDPFENQRWGR